MQTVRAEHFPVGTYITITNGVCQGATGLVIRHTNSGAHVIRLDPPKTWCGRDEVIKVGWRLAEMFDVGM